MSSLTEPAVTPDEPDVKLIEPSTDVSTKQKPSDGMGGYVDKPWIPRIWDGMLVSGWFRLLVRNRFWIAPQRWAMAVIVSFCTVMNSLLHLVQTLFYGRRIAETEIQGDPIFVIGHWRSGTTMLHELLVLDKRYTFPNWYDCFAPNHFLLTAWFFRPLLGILMPKLRPMDNMAAGWDRPQEDEFALCNMGLPSPYLTFAFGNNPPQYPEYFDLRQVSPAEKSHWQQKFKWFLKCLTVRSPKRVVLKSPPHTFRVAVLLEMFPKAKFVHIIRNPYAIFPSTVNLWKRLYRNEGLQVPTYAGLEEYVLATFEQMYETLERDREVVPEGQFCEVRYEDLIKDPVAQMKTIYDKLGLGDFEQVQPELNAYVASQADYKTNKYKRDSQWNGEIRRRWGFFFERYGYPLED